MDLQPYYVALVDFGDMGFGHGCDPTDFGSACDAYAEYRDKGYEAGVFRCEPGTPDQAGMMIDVTADADARISRHADWSHAGLPEWLGGTEAETIAEDITHERQESRPDLF